MVPISRHGTAVDEQASQFSEQEGATMWMARVAAVKEIPTSPPCDRYRIAPPSYALEIHGTLEEILTRSSNFCDRFCALLCWVKLRCIAM